MTNRTRNRGDEAWRAMRWARCVPLLVAVWAGTMLAPAGRAEEKVRPAPRASCTPTALVVVVTSVDTNAVVPLGWPVALRVHVVNDCGDPLTQGSVVLTFSNGDRPIALVSLGNGDWAGTWVPQGSGKAILSVVAQDASGLLRGTTIVSVTATSSPPQVSLSPRDPNAFAVAGGEPVTLDLKATSGAPVEFFVRDVIFAGESVQFTANPPRATTPATVEVLVNVPLVRGNSVYQVLAVVEFPNNSSYLTLPVTFGVRPAPDPALLVDTSPVLFSTVGAADRQNRQFFVRNASGIPLTFTAEASGGNWLKPVLQAYPFDAYSEPLPGASAQDCSSCPITFRSPGILGITVDPAGLPSGAYFGSITLSDDAGDSPQVIPVTMLVSGEDPSILVSQTGLKFAAVEGGFTEPAQSFFVLNPGAGDLDWTAKVSEGAGWLQIDSAAGQSSAGTSQNPQITVTADGKGLTAGQYYAQIEVSSNQADNGPVIVSVVLDVLPQGSKPIPFVRPSGLVFTGITGGAVPPSQTIVISNISGDGTGFSPFRVFSNTFDGAGWLLADVVDSTGTYVQPPATLVPGTPSKAVVRSLLQTPANEILAAGVRRGLITVFFNDGSVRDVAVLYVLAPTAASKPAPPAASRSADGCATKLQPLLTSLGNQFQGTAGWPAPIEVRVVDDCAQALTSGSVVATFTGGEDPVALTHVQNGNWTGTWVPRNKTDVQQVSVLAKDNSRDISGESQTVVGRVTADADTPVIDPKTIADEVSKIRRTYLAPGSRFSVYGDRLLDNCGNGSSPQVAGVSLQMHKTEMPLLRAPSCGRIDAVLPYDLPVDHNFQLFLLRNGSASAGTSVTIAAGAPSIFTADGSGQGMALAYRVDNAGNALALPIGTTQPAIAGGLVVIECAGLGAVGNDGSVKNSVKVKIGDADVKAQSATLIDSAAGRYRVTVLVPLDTPASDAVPVVISACDVSVSVCDKASAEVTIPVGLP